MEQPIENQVESDENNPQHDIMKSIHIEFQQPFIKKLYPHLEWTGRIYWNVVGVIQGEYCGRSLDDLCMSVDRYLRDHKMVIPRPD